MILANLSDIAYLREQIVNIILEEKNIEAIISFIDPYVSTAAQLCQDLCGRNLSVSAYKIAENKIETRKALNGTPYNINYCTHSTGKSDDTCLQQNSLNFPLVIKFPKSSGSRDVFLIDTPQMFNEFIDKAEQEFPNKTLLIEEYVEGDQYLVEVVIYKGKIQPVAIIKQDINLYHRFIVTGYSIDLNLSKNLCDSLNGAIEKILTIIGLKEGTCHLELRLKNDQWKVIEINPRLSGGAMNQMIKAGFGIDLLEQTIKLYIDHPLCLERKTENNVYTYYIISRTKGIVRKVTGISKARQKPGVKEVMVNVRKGNTVSPPLSMGHRLGYIISTGDTIEKAESSAKKAAKLIKISLQSASDKNKHTHDLSKEYK